VSILKQLRFNTDESLFGVFDGRHNSNVPRLIVSRMPEVLRDAMMHHEAPTDYMKYAMLTMHRSGSALLPVSLDVVISPPPLSSVDPSLSLGSEPECLSRAVLGMPEQGGGNGGTMEVDEAQLTTDKLSPSILVMQQHILLLKYRRDELHWGATGGPDF